MGLWNVIANSCREIWGHKLRSLLTTVGVVLGVMSLVTMVAIVEGMERGLREALIAVGGVEKVDVYENDVPAYQYNLADQVVGLSLRDMKALQRGAPLIELVTAELRLPHILLTRHGRSFVPWSFLGTTPNALEMNHHELACGRMFNEIDDETARNVCVIGTTIRSALFGPFAELEDDARPLGEQIMINDQPFTIIGMFQHYESDAERQRRQLAEHQQDQGGAVGPARRRGGFSSGDQEIFLNKNATIYVPITTAWTKLRPIFSPDIRAIRPTSLALKVRHGEDFEHSLQQARNILMLTHHGIEDFYFFTAENKHQGIAEATRKAQLSGGIIAAISLLAGGIGIVNIMLASLNDRIREIGVRKAVGATNGDLFWQVLVESTLLAVVGGLLGLSCSWGFVRVIEWATPMQSPPVITLSGLVLGLASSTVVGLLAGAWPAVKAARLSPAEALHYG